MGKKKTGEEEQFHVLVFFFSLTERQISKKQYHKVTAHFAEIVKARSGGRACMCLCMGRWMVM